MTGPPLTGQTAVVAGASRGIGLATAERLLAAGAHVVRLARSLADAEGERRTDLRCDLTDPAQVTAAARRVVEGPGVPDLLVHNAGAFLARDLLDTTPAEFAGQVAGNLAGPFLVLHAFVPPMVARGRGLVIAVGSVADHLALPGNAAYVAAKHGLRGLLGALAKELQGTGVRLSLVSPGPVDTALWDPVDPDAKPGFVKRAAMLRAEDVAEAVLFLATRPDRVAIPVLHIEPRP